MRELALREAESRLDVLLKVLGLLDGSDDSTIDRLLVSRLGLGERSLLLGLALREELLLRRLRPLRFRFCEVIIRDFVADLYFHSY